MSVKKAKDKIVHKLKQLKNIVQITLEKAHFQKTILHGVVFCTYFFNVILWLHSLCTALPPIMVTPSWSNKSKCHGEENMK